MTTKPVIQAKLNIFKTVINDVLCNSYNSSNLIRLRASNPAQYDLLVDLLVCLISNIIVLFHIEDIDIFLEKLKSSGDGKGRDIWGLFYLLLPFISSKDELSMISSLNDLYVVTTNRRDNNDPEQNILKFKYTNTQYNRYKRDTKQFIQYEPSHLIHNYRLLIRTIQTISSRMYVNWVNVVPVLDFTKLPEFIETQLAIDNHLISTTDQLIEYDPAKPLDNIISYQHMFVGTIYETIYHCLYKSIKNVKWLLYDINLTNKLDIFADEERDIHNIPTGGKTVFQYLSEQPFLPLDKLLKDISYDELTEDEQKKYLADWLLIKTAKHHMLLVYIISAFDKYYQDIEDIKSKGYEPILDTQKPIYGDVEKHFDKMMTLKLYRHMYEFMRHSVGQYKSTIYFKVKNIESMKLDDIPKPRPDATLTFKNIFNFAKSFCCHFQAGHNEDSVRMHPRWESLDTSERQIIINRLNNRTAVDTDRTWFNIRNNLKRQYGTDDIGTLNSLNYYTRNMCIKNIPKLVMLCLQLSGTLSQFVATAINPTNDISKYDECYYYLTETKYKDILTYKKKDNRLVKYADFNTKSSDDVAKKRLQWYERYALDWVAQINFFHKYINNRIIFVTGGTGVGKSTQIPKLLLYATKMLDWKYNGRVVVTQPRRRPTTENAGIISVELGVPITEKIDNNVESITGNYFVQYKTHERKHTRSNTGHLMLRIQTDKTLLNELSNPIMKITNGDKYTTRNIYDVVAVDESHEHNANMDMILTLMRDVCYYNNECKLVIISATMEDDEPTYRRYYRDINDNMTYPLSRTIINQVDRINVDRRLDISIPNQLNNYTITETYIDSVPTNEKADNERNMFIISLINERLKNSNTKDILVFKSGRREIEECVKVINASTRADAIAIPYYGDLTQELREALERIPTQKDVLKINKTSIINEDTNVNDLKKGNGIYKHVIIVATTIAEASITIDTLTDVIDEGIRKTPSYSPMHNGAVIKKGYISEQSRKQRRGRVGRVANGNIYYLYKSNALENTPNAYDICISDITETLLSLIITDNAFVLFDANDPNRIKLDIFDNTKITDRKNVIEMIREQYYIKTLNGDNMQYQRYTYEGLVNQYDYINKRTISQRYENGYGAKELYDKDGIFYIIHPNEMNMKRNTFGNIIQQPLEERISLHLHKPTDMLLCINDNGNIIKTYYGEQISKLSATLFLDKAGIYYTIACCFAKIYDCLDDVIKIIAMIQVGSTLPDCPSKCSSDLIVLLQLMNKMLAVRQCFVHDKDVKLTPVINTCVTNIAGDTNSSIYFKCVSNYHNLIMKLHEEKTWELFNECISKSLNSEYIRSRSVGLQTYELITLSFLHAFGYNIIKKIGSHELYVPMKYPIKSNVKEISQIKKTINTCVQPIYRANYMFYTGLIISDNDEQFVNSHVQLLHYVDPVLLKHISYQHNIEEYIARVTADNKSVTSETATHDILRQYGKTIQELMNDMKKNYESGTHRYFKKISKNSVQIMNEKDKRNVGMI